jgi:radical SAM superfamily enzyme YgiQ (UPF0313 family)
MNNILDEFSFINSFHFDDDILFLDKEWFYEFASLYSTEIRKPYSCNMRPNLVTEEAVKLLAETGCDLVQMGIESGNEDIRNRVLKRGLKEQTILKAFELCKAAGMKVSANCMVGIPFESPSTVLDSIKLISRVWPDSTNVAIFYPYKGTALYDVCKKENYLTKRDNVDYYTDSILSLPDLSRKQIIMFRGYFNQFAHLYRFVLKYKGKIGRYGIKLIDKILCSNIFAWMMANLYPVMRWLWLNVINRSYKSFKYPIKDKITYE